MAPWAFAILDLVSVSWWFPLPMRFVDRDFNIQLALTAPPIRHDSCCEPEQRHVEARPVPSKPINPNAVYLGSTDHSYATSPCPSLSRHDKV